MPIPRANMMGTLIADDLTGSCDAAAPLSGRGPVGVFLDRGLPGVEWRIAAVDTETRGLAAPEAAQRVRAIALRLGARLSRGWLFKKIDSTLRGPVGAEVDALLSASGRRTALVCPALPGQGRTVSGGELRVGGVPAHRSPVGRDPAYASPTSDVAGILRLGSRRPVSHLSLATVRGEAGKLGAVLARARDRIIAADAETDADLDALAAAALPIPELLLAGSAGLARAAAVALGEAGPAASLPAGRAWLIVAGSLHPATRAQVRALEAAGVVGSRVGAARDRPPSSVASQIAAGQPAFITTGDSVETAPGARSDLAGRLARAAAAVLAAVRPDLVAVTGGETAVALLRAIGATRVEIYGAPSSGLALGLAVVTGAAAIPLLTKAGGFGPPDLFTGTLAPAPARRAPAL